MSRYFRMSLALLILLAAVPCGAALVRPYPGYGNFPMTVDVAYRWDEDGSLDLDVMVELRSGHLMFVRPVPGLPFQADLDVIVKLEGIDGQVYELTRHQEVHELTLERATSTRRANTFVYTLEDVSSPSGELSVYVTDRHQERRGPRGWREHAQAFSEMSCYWVAPRAPAEFDGFSLGDPFFMIDYSDVDLFGRRILRKRDETYRDIHDHLHLARQYGLRQRYLQFACEVRPPETDREAILDHEGLLMQIVHRELRFSLEDTLQFTESEKTRLTLGEPVIVFHEVDVEHLPPGTFLLSCASLDGKGRPWVAEFDVVWSLGVPRRRGDEELALAKLLFPPEEVSVFQAGDAVRRRDMMDAFWAPLDPEPDTPQNEAWIEFQERVGYVRQHLGGFGLDGSMDPRAEIYLELGTPARIAFEKDASNEADRIGPEQRNWNDFFGFIDTRVGLSSIPAGGKSVAVRMTDGAVAFGVSASQQDLYFSGGSGGQPTSGKFPGSMVGPLVGTSHELFIRNSRGNNAEGEPVTETWFYPHCGFPLFENAWSDSVPRGFRFGYEADAAGYELRKAWELEPDVFGVPE